MKLLSPAYIKDAARSVKRICEEMFTEAHDSVLTELLGIAALKVNMYGVRSEGEEKVLHLRCSHRNDIAVRPRCGAVSEAVHEEKERCVRHLDIWEKRTFLHFYSRRFRCEDCGKPFTESLSFVEKFRRHTAAFEQHIYERCRTGCRKKVAKQERLSQATVKEILNRFARCIPERSGCLLTRVLGIDEISLKKRHKQFVLVISDISSGSVLAVPAILNFNIIH